VFSGVILYKASLYLAKLEKEYNSVEIDDGICEEEDEIYDSISETGSSSSSWR
jgi:hypothetical protein